MGVSFDREVRIAGYGPAVFKDPLRGFMRTRSPGDLIDLKSVFPLRRDGATVFEECLDRGLIEFKGEAAISEKGDFGLFERLDVHQENHAGRRPNSVGTRTARFCRRDRAWACSELLSVGIFVAAAA
jgi:hypothetical protein